MIRPKPTYTTYAAIALAALVVFTLVLAAVMSSRKAGTVNPRPSASASPVASINPKTDTEQARRDAATPTLTPRNSAGNKPSLKPVITGVDGADNTSASIVAVDALPSGATSGTCTATLTQGSTHFTATSQIALVTSYYACSTMRFDKDELAAGSWTLVVSVDSPSGAGSSDPQTITVKK